MAELFGLLFLVALVYSLLHSSAYEEGYRAGKREGSRKAYGVGFERGRRSQSAHETGCVVPLVGVLIALLAAGIALC